MRDPVMLQLVDDKAAHGVVADRGSKANGAVVTGESNGDVARRAAQISRKALCLRGFGTIGGRIEVHPRAAQDDGVEVMRVRARGKGQRHAAINASKD